LERYQGRAIRALVPSPAAAGYAIGLPIVSKKVKETPPATLAKPEPEPQPVEQPPPLRASLAVVSHNRIAWLRRCLRAVEGSEERERLQVIVIDNGSLDGSAQLDDEFPRVQFIRLPKNFGLTKALNLGWRAADSPYVFFLHEDTEVEPSAARRLADVLDANPQAAGACPLLIGEDGLPAPQLGTLPPDGAWRPAEPAGAEPFAVEYARGAALMMRVTAIKAIRQIDERYGQFGSDADLAEQVRRASKQILLVPEARVRHHGQDGYTTEEQADFLLGRAVFLGKYQGFLAGLKARIGAILGPLMRLQLGQLKYTVPGQKIDGTKA
jgi:GT2 family glycosyltransferase